MVYRIKNKLTGKVYVGSTTKKLLCQRWSQHLYKARKTSDSLLCQAIRTHGKNAFIIDRLETVENETRLREREKFWIERLGSLYPNGYNSIIGKGKYSEKTILKMSKAQKAGHIGRKKDGN